MPCIRLCSIIFFLIYKRILISCISQLLHNKTFLCLSSDLNDIMDIAALTAVVAHDSYFDAQRIQSDYSPALIPTVTQHYDEIHTTYICDELLTSNFVRFRFALNRPIATLDYAPIIIGHHNWLMLKSTTSLKFRVPFFLARGNHDSLWPQRTIIYPCSLQDTLLYWCQPWWSVASKNYNISLQPTGHITLLRPTMIACGLKGL